MTVSIIIAAKTWQKNLEECVNKCLELDYDDFEIIILPDAPFSIRGSISDNPLIKVIATGPISPGQKRDMAVKFAKGEILGFIDDDAYPTRDWLKSSLPNFHDSEVAAVCGPAITPDEDSLRQKASGLVYASFLVSGRFIYRYVPEKKQEVDDYPSCNFLVRKSTFKDAGGFDTNFWPGEDTKLCLDITKRLKKRIIYDPEVLVYHHRRPVYLGHLKQITHYALHRGYFVKRYPQTSLRISYFIPSFLLLFFLGGGILASFFSFFRTIYLSILSFYLWLVAIFSLNKNFWLTPFIFSGIILTHLTYGFCFIKGLLSKRIPEEIMHNENYNCLSTFK